MNIRHNKDWDTVVADKIGYHYSARIYYEEEEGQRLYWFEVEQIRSIPKEVWKQDRIVFKSDQNCDHDEVVEEAKAKIAELEGEIEKQEQDEANQASQHDYRVHQPWPDPRRLPHGGPQARLHLLLQEASRLPPNQRQTAMSFKSTGQLLYEKRSEQMGNNPVWNRLSDKTVVWGGGEFRVFCGGTQVRRFFHKKQTPQDTNRN